MVQISGRMQAGRVDGRPIRACFLIDGLGTGGTETQLLALIRNLDRDVVRPYLVLLDGEDEESRAMEPADCPVIRLGVRRLLTLRSLGKLGEFRRFLRREAIDVLQLYFPDSTYFGAMAGRLAGTRFIVRTRNNVNHWMTPTHRRLGRLMNRFVTVTLCNTEAARQAVLADECPDPESVVVIENGVDLERFSDLPRFRVEGDPCRPRRVGMVANLRPVKGVDVFVRAAARVASECADVTFHVAGEGPQRPELERLIAELGLAGRFALEGALGDVPAFLGGLDVAVLSSRAEGLPNAVLEYMAAGRPIVATAVGGVPGIVSDGVHARLVAPESPESLAVAMVDLLNDRGEAARLARAAREHVQLRFSRATSVNRFQELYRTMTPSLSERSRLLRDPFASLTRKVCKRGGWRVYPFLNRRFGGGQATAWIDGVGLMRLNLDEPSQAALYWTGLDRTNRTIVRHVDRHLPEGGVIIDVGGHIGMITLAASRRISSRSGRVIAFEPHPANGRALARNVELNATTNVTLEPFGLSDRNDRLRVRGQDSEGNWSIASDGPFEFDIELIPLDEYVRSKQIDRIDVIKMDVEGNELAALRGARESLRRFRPVIIFELNPYWLRKMGAGSGELIGFLHSESYTVHRIPADPSRVGRRVSAEEAEGMGNDDWTNLVALP